MLPALIRTIFWNIAVISARQLCREKPESKQGADAMLTVQIRKI